MPRFLSLLVIWTSFFAACPVNGRQTAPTSQSIGWCYEVWRDGVVVAHSGAASHEFEEVLVEFTTPPLLAGDDRIVSKQSLLSAIEAEHEGPVDRRYCL
jgi:hypothetical protein